MLPKSEYINIFSPCSYDCLTFTIYDGTRRFPNVAVNRENDTSFENRLVMGYADL